MKKKIYIHPTLEILPFCAVSSLCQSDGGLDPEEFGRTPERPLYY